jgi:hypothetical protein
MWNYGLEKEEKSKLMFKNKKRTRSNSKSISKNH